MFEGFNSTVDIFKLSESEYVLKDGTNVQCFACTTIEGHLCTIDTILYMFNLTLVVQLSHNCIFTNEVHLV